VIYRLKYGGEKEISSALGMLMAEILAAKGWSIRAIVPVPIHPFRLAERGYNQSLLLAEEIGRECGIDVSDSVLVRNRNTMSQTQMPARERLANVRGAFGPGEDRRTVKGPLLLVDDIMTTGATLNECSRVLREMGAQKVYCLTAACPLYV
jgi:ComF family protein